MRTEIMLRAMWAGAAALTVLVAIGGISSAQDTSTGSTVNSAQAPKEQKTGVTTLEALELSQAGADVDAQLTELMKESDARFLEEITLIGRGRGVAAAQGTLGQVVWYGISATVDGEERRAGLASPLKSSFMASQANVDTGAEIEAVGDLEALKEAAKALLEDPEAEEEKSEGEGDEEDDEDEEQREPAKQSNAAGGTGQTGSLPPYEPIDYPDDESDSGSSSPEVEMVTTEGCQPRVLLDQGVVYLQSKLVTMKDGVIVKEGTCTDSFESIPIQKSYAGCEYSVSLEAMKAWPQYRPYYVNNDGEPIYITDCMPEENNPTDIVRDSSACAPLIDLENLVVTKAYELVYTSQSGGRVVVASCRPDEEDTLPIATTADGCGYRHDMPNNQSFRQERKIYVQDGVTVAVSSCEDTGEALPHILDTAACEPQVDYTTKKVTPAARRMIATDIGMVTIAECAPSPELAVDLFATYEGCERIFVHNVDGGESYRTERFYYEMNAGEKSYVGTCVTAADVPALKHQLETVSWQNNDTARTALPVTRIYITWEAEQFEVSSAQVRPDAVAVPYTFVKTDTVADLPGTYYEGCSKYVPTKTTDVYQRPDTTQALYPTGNGPVQGPTAACTSQPINMLYVDSYGGGSYRQCRYRGQSVKLREDGQTILGSWVTPAAFPPSNTNIPYGWYLMYDAFGASGATGSWTIGTGTVKDSAGSGTCRERGTGTMKSGFAAYYGLN